MDAGVHSPLCSLCLGSLVEPVGLALDLLHLKKVSDTVHLYMSYKLLQSIAKQTNKTKEIVTHYSSVSYQTTVSCRDASSLCL